MLDYRENAATAYWPAPGPSASYYRQMEIPYPAAPRQLVVVRNPVARRQSPYRDLVAALEQLRRAGWSARIDETERPGHGTVLAREAVAQGADVVVAAGGDGTVNEILNGLAGSPTALAVLPTGTANVWAGEIGVGRDPAAALAVVTGGRRLRIDSGIAQLRDGLPRRFLLMCSAGLDAAVVRDLEEHPQLKPHLGQAAFLWPALRAFARVRPVLTTVVSGGTARRGSLTMAIAGNTRGYGGIASVTSGALADDGLLDLVVFGERPGAHLNRLRQLAWALGQREGVPRPSSVHEQRVRDLELRPEGPLAIQVDGEFLGEASRERPLRLSLDPGSVSVLLPHGPNPLFGNDG